jgi:hypothetical protein
MAKKATRLMREATYRWAIWRAEGTPGELDLACRLARQALAWAVGQRQPVLAGQARRLVEALERERREYSARCRPPVEAAARAQEIIPADELEAGTVRGVPTPLYELAPWVAVIRDEIIGHESLAIDQLLAPTSPWGSQGWSSP